ncbi:TorF family putative porin [Thioalkalivibrio sulfidiphilus]|uniref:TorF family putative porin n=1 Tax=Thioalkalivibrio sulfidiphilus TaxID=1033854 RepID=UPI000360387A|nr:TorF family putative porin [Thioalkalivibrio sulfidiphilus]
MHPNLKKSMINSAVAGALMVGAAGFSTAKAELTFNAGAFSDYILWGVSASGGNAVVQGGVDYEHESGFYLGTWMSTLGDGEGQEVDLYLGYAFEAGDLEFDIGYVYYYYPALDDFDYGDIYASVGFGPVYASVNYAVHADDSDYEGSTVYAIGGGLEILPSVTFDAEIGYTEQKFTGGSDKWTFWTLGLTKSTDMGDISLTYAQTDESDIDPLFVVGYSISF